MQKNEKNAIFEVSLKFIIKNDREETLILKMPSGGSMSGYYDLPGGRIRDQEKTKPFNKIFNRELQEELGINAHIDLNKIPVAIGRHAYPDKTSSGERYIFWVFFEGRYLNGLIKISSEHEDYKWVKLRKSNIEKYFVRGPLEGMYHYLYRDFYNEQKKEDGF